MTAGRRVVSPTLVGRADELSLLVSAVCASPAVVVVEGEAGVGKSRLVAELQAHPEVRGRRFATGWCRRIREPFPLGPVIEAVRGLGDELARVALSPVAGALRPLLPEIAHLLPPRPETPGSGAFEDRVAQRHQIFRALVELLGSLGPVVLLVEDLHWADEHTADFVSYLLDDPPPGLALVVTFRGEEVDPGIRALTARLPASVRAENIVLAALDEKQTGELAAAIVDAEAVSQEFAAYLCARTGGLPFAIEEVLALLRERGVMARRERGWARRALTELEVPPAIRDHVLERASRLPAQVRPVIDAVAVLQVPASDHLIAAVTEQSPAQVSDAVSLAIESGLLVEHGEDAAFRHVLAAQAVYDALTGPHRRQLHSRAADALAQLSSGMLGHIAYHLERAGRLGHWAIAAEEAADQAATLGHDGEAVRLLESVLRTAHLESGARGRIAVKLGRAALNTLYSHEVTSLLLDVLDGPVPNGLRSELGVLIAVGLSQTGERPLLRRELFTGAAAGLDDRPDLKAWAMLGLGLPRAADVPLSEDLSWLRRTLDVLPEIDDPAFRVFMLGKIAMVLVSVGEPDWRELTDRVLQQTGGAPRRRREVIAYLSVAIEACYAGHHEAAARLLTAGGQGAAELETGRPEVLLRAARATLDYYSGSWQGLPERAEGLLDELDGRPPYYNNVTVVAGCLALARGELEQARHRLDGVVTRLEENGAVELLPVPAATLVRMAIAGGEGAEAAAGAERLLASLEPKGLWAPAARALPALTEAMVMAARPADGRALVARFADELRHRDAPLIPAALAHARGILERGAGRWHPAAGHFREAAERYVALQCPYEAAQARENASECLFTSADAKAGELLHAALVTYQRLGASWDFDRAASTARERGVPVPARHRGGRRGYGRELSPREREVARLAAAGRTNKQIAGELFLSPETVKQHLRTAMRKLGVQSRVTLAEHLLDRERKFDPFGG